MALRVGFVVAFVVVVVVVALKDWIEASGECMSLSLIDRNPMIHHAVIACIFSPMFVVSILLFHHFGACFVVK